jgi:predicted ArsR family transcriptional regulator
MFEPKARNTDPITSHMAAESAKELARKHRERIAQCLMQGPCGVSELAVRAGLEPHQAGKRMKELEQEGLAIPTGKTVRSRSGRQEREWIAAIPY